MALSRWCRPCMIVRSMNGGLSLAGSVSRRITRSRCRRPNRLFRGGWDMKGRLLESLGVVMMLAVILVLLEFTAVPMRGQADGTNAWGHPNLEGIWLDVYATPFERAPALGDREFATLEERATVDQARMGNVGRDRRGPRGSPQDVSGAYNAVYTSVKPAGPRTSLVVDPPNGRIPAPDARGPAGGRDPARVARHAHEEHPDLRARCTRLRRRAIRSPIAAPVRCPALLQHAAHEPPRRPGGSELGRSVHAWRDPRFQRVPSYRAGRGFDRTGL